MSKKVLILGSNSFAGSGLYGFMKDKNYDVKCFNRGIEGFSGDEIRGDVFQLSKNPFLKDQKFDVAINFILIKDGSVSDNLSFLEELSKFCDSNVKSLIQISSISAYQSSLQNANEYSVLETSLFKKGSYSRIKTSNDIFLINRDNRFQLVLVRPGFIVDEKSEISITGIAAKLISNIYILLGDKSSSLPLVEKSRFHEALYSILRKKSRMAVYNIFESHFGTKYEFMKRFFPQKKLVYIPRFFVLPVVRSALFLFREKTILHQIISLYKDTKYSSELSQLDLKMNFSSGSTVIIGAGTYGSYFINSFISYNPHKRLKLFEIGDEHLRNEEEIGLGQDYINKSIYKGLELGRYFGFGGSSKRWGGQILFLNKKDFDNPNKFLSDLIEINETYKDIVLRRLGMSHFKETIIHLKKRTHLRQGVWLNYFNRNLFRFFKIKSKISSSDIITQSRVLELLFDDFDRNKIIGLKYRNFDGGIEIFYSDYTILCAGAFESNRILFNSGLIHGCSSNFSDHLSKPSFKIFGSPKSGELDFYLKRNGFNLISSRIIGEINGVSYFAHPIFNKESVFFETIKSILFRNELNRKNLFNLVTSLPSFISFIVYFVFLKKLYVLNDYWELFIDIENPSKTNSINYKGDDNNRIDVKYSLDMKELNTIYSEIEKEVSKILTDHKFTFEKVKYSYDYSKLEDTYHPYGLGLSSSKSLEELHLRNKNLFVISTGILPRIGGINPTGALFPYIEYINDKIISR